MPHSSSPDKLLAAHVALGSQLAPGRAVLQRPPAVKPHQHGRGRLGRVHAAGRARSRLRGQGLRRPDPRPGNAHVARPSSGRCRPDATEQFSPAITTYLSLFSARIAPDRSVQPYDHCRTSSPPGRKIASPRARTLSRPRWCSDPLRPAGRRSAPPAPFSPAQRPFAFVYDQLPRPTSSYCPVCLSLRLLCAPGRVFPPPPDNLSLPAALLHLRLLPALSCPQLRLPLLSPLPFSVPRL